MKEAQRTPDVDLASRRAQLSQELAEQLSAAHESITMYELRIDDALSRGDGDAASAIKNEAISELDASWPFHNKQIQVVGTWHRGQILSTGEPNEFRLDIASEQIASEQTSLGFSAISIDGKARIGLCFFTGKIAFASPLTGVEVTNNAIALLNEASFSVGSSFALEDSPALMRQIAGDMLMQDKLIKLIKARGPEDARPRDYRKKIGEIVTKANGLLCADEVPYVIGIESKTVFRHTSADEEGGLECLEAVTDTPISIQGRLLGATALELIEDINGSPGSQLLPEDTLGVGLVFAIEPAEHNIPTPGDPARSIVYVPLQPNTTQFKLSLPTNG